MYFTGRLLVLGGGFIGASILKCYPSAFFISRTKIESNHRHYLWPANLAEWLELLKIVNPEGIIVCFGKPLAKRIQTNPDIAFADHLTKILGFLNAINAIKNNLNLIKIVVVGSASEYGSLINQAIVENAQSSELNTYGALKLSIFHICQFYHQFYNLPICYIRQFNTSGPGQTSDFVLPSIVSQYLKYLYGIQEVMNIGDLEIYRDFIHIEDALNAYDILLQKGEVGQCYNLCSNKVSKIKDTLDYLTNKFGKSPRYNLDKNLKQDENQRKNYILGNNDKLKNLGWSPKKTFEDMIDDIIEFEKKAMR